MSWRRPSQREKSIASSLTSSPLMLGASVLCFPGYRQPWSSLEKSKYRWQSSAGTARGVPGTSREASGVSSHHRSPGPSFSRLTCEPAGGWSGATSTGSPSSFMCYASTPTSWTRFVLCCAVPCHWHAALASCPPFRTVSVLWCGAATGVCAETVLTHLLWCRLGISRQEGSVAYL